MQKKLLLTLISFYLYSSDQANTSSVSLKQLNPLEANKRRKEVEESIEKIVQQGLNFNFLLSQSELKPSSTLECKNRIASLCAIDENNILVGFRSEELNLLDKNFKVVKDFKLDSTPKILLYLSDNLVIAALENKKIVKIDLQKDNLEDLSCCSDLVDLLKLDNSKFLLFLKGYVAVFDLNEKKITKYIHVPKARSMDVYDSDKIVVGEGFGASFDSFDKYNYYLKVIDLNSGIERLGFNSNMEIKSVKKIDKNILAAVIGNRYVYFFDLKTLEQLFKVSTSSSIDGLVVMDSNKVLVDCGYKGQYIVDFKNKDLINLNLGKNLSLVCSLPDGKFVCSENKVQKRILSYFDLNYLVFNFIKKYSEENLVYNQDYKVDFDISNFELTSTGIEKIKTYLAGLKNKKTSCVLL